MTTDPLSQNRTWKAGLGRTLIASVSLLVLLASWLPHDHDPAGVHSDSFASSSSSSPSSSYSPVAASCGPSSTGLSVRPDDSHDTHSAGRFAEELPCALCRSAGEREELAALQEGLLPTARALVGSRALFRAPLRKPSSHGRLPLGRAPPSSIAS